MTATYNHEQVCSPAVCNLGLCERTAQVKPPQQTPCAALVQQPRSCPNMWQEVCRRVRALHPLYALTLLHCLLYCPLLYC